MDIQEHRRENLRAWVAQNGTPQKEKSYFSQLLGKVATFGERAARRLERDYVMGDGYLDTPSRDKLLAFQAEIPTVPLPPETQWLLSAWQSASEEDKEIARLVLAGHDAPLPPWADKDMRQFINGMRYAALRWLRSKSEQKKTPPKPSCTVIDGVIYTDA